MRRKEYYMAEILRAIIFPVIFLIVVLIFIFLNIYVGEPVDLWTWANYSLITLIALLICYLLGYYLTVKKKLWWQR